MMMHRGWGRWRFAVGMVLAGVVFAPLVLSRHRASIIKPGSLSSPHAQILAGRSDANACSACHEPASLGLILSGSTSHVATADQVGQSDSLTDDATMSQRCVHCHSDKIPSETMGRPHHLTRPRQRELTKKARARLDDPSDVWSLVRHRPSQLADSDSIGCSTCHQEHHGDDASLVAMSDSQCQSCHSATFASFSDGHPQWPQQDWVATGITFDHNSHASRHYPTGRYSGEIRQFDCGDCHRVASDGQMNVAVDYGQACGHCHEQPLRLATQPGFEWLRLPPIADDAEPPTPNWPSDLIGSIHPVAPSPVTSWLIDHASSSSAGEELATRRLGWLRTMSDRGQAAAAKQLEDAGVDRSLAEQIIATMPPQMVSLALQRWLTGRSSVGSGNHSHEFSADARSRKPQLRNPSHHVDQSGNAANDDRFAGEILVDEFQGDYLLDDDLLNDDPSDDDLLDDDLLVATVNDSNDGDALLPLAEEPSPMKEHSVAPELFRAFEMLVAGGWYVDDLNYAIRYAGGGHGDPVLAALIEAAAVSDDPAAAEFLRTPMVAACSQCHPIATLAESRWRSAPRSTNGSTHFSHTPHLNIASLVDCQSCHQFRDRNDAVESFTTNHFDTAESDFAIMTVQHCATCHNETAASQSCTLCHDYHWLDGHDGITRRTDTPLLRR